MIKRPYEENLIFKSDSFFFPRNAFILPVFFHSCCFLIDFHENSRKTGQLITCNNQVETAKIMEDFSVSSFYRIRVIQNSIMYEPHVLFANDKNTIIPCSQYYSVKITHALYVQQRPNKFTSKVFPWCNHSSTYRSFQGKHVSGISLQILI